MKTKKNMSAECKPISDIGQQNMIIYKAFPCEGFFTSGLLDSDRMFAAGSSSFYLKVMLVAISNSHKVKPHFRVKDDEYF